jgi:cyclase
MKILSISIIAASVIAATAMAQEPVWDANTAVLESQKLAEGVFAVIEVGTNDVAASGIPIATSSGFVVDDESVLVIDTMLNERLHTQLFDLIAIGTDLPVRYAVNTSFHGNQYLPEESLITQHGFTSEFIPVHIEADKAFMIQNFGPGRGIKEIMATPADILVGAGDSLTIDLGSVTVDNCDYDFVQTGADLFVSVPSANMLWTGNPVITEAPALPWLLDAHLIETSDTLRAVLADFDALTQIVQVMAQ